MSVHITGLAAAGGYFDTIEATFHGAGRTRCAGAGAYAAASAQADQDLAKALVGEGLHPWRSDEAVTRVDLATEGTRFSTAALELRPWGVFGSVERREAARAMAQMASFLDEEDPERRDVRDVVVLTLRRRGGLNNVPTGDLARHHVEFTELLGGMQDYAARRHEGRAMPLSYGVHHRMQGVGDIVDLNGHLAVYVERGPAGEEALHWLVEYLTRKFVVFVSPRRTRADDIRRSAAAAWYEEDSFSPPMAGEAAERVRWLAEYVRQVHLDHHLHRRTTLGPLRKHVGVLRLARVHPVMEPPEEATAPEDTHVQFPTTANPEFSSSSTTTAPDQPSIHPVVSYRPIRVRPTRYPRPPGMKPGPRILTAKLSWLDDKLCPVILVKGWNPSTPEASWRSLMATYHLGGLIAAARWALPMDSFVPPA